MIFGSKVTPRKARSNVPRDTPCASASGQSFAMKARKARSLFFSILAWAEALAAARTHNESTAKERKSQRIIPARAGIRAEPAFRRSGFLDSRLRGNDMAGGTNETIMKSSR